MSFQRAAVNCDYCQKYAKEGNKIETCKAHNEAMKALEDEIRDSTEENRKVAAEKALSTCYFCYLNNYKGDEESNNEMIADLIFNW